MIKRLSIRLWEGLASLHLTIISMSLLMVLVVLCTVSQVNLGTLGAVNTYMRSLVVWWHLPAGSLTLPVFPGGALVGLALTLNLTVALIKRFVLSWAKAGLWIIHAGLILLVAGEFVTGAFQVDTRMSIEEGQTQSFVEHYRESELAVLDTTHPAYDELYSIPESLLAKGGTVPLPGTPLTIKVHRYFANAELANRAANDPPSQATVGVGPSVRITEQPAVTADNDMNHTSAYIEPLAGTRSYGVWLVSNVLAAPQSFVHEGRTYVLAMRARREYLPYTLTLKKFSHDVYAGTDIPKNFSSLVTLHHAPKGEHRDVLIYMNQPLRYEGRAFYQASFGKGDTLTILQVVSNPGWLLPYISCVLITLGLLVHFAVMLRRSMRRRLGLLED